LAGCWHYQKKLLSSVMVLVWLDLGITETKEPIAGTVTLPFPKATIVVLLQSIIIFCIFRLDSCNSLPLTPSRREQSPLNMGLISWYGCGALLVGLLDYWLPLGM
jgi:hypothetical protein